MNIDLQEKNEELEEKLSEIEKIKRLAINKDDFDKAYVKEKEQ